MVTVGGAGIREVERVEVERLEVERLEVESWVECLETHVAGATVALVTLVAAALESAAEAISRWQS